MLVISLWVIIMVVQASAPARMASAFWHLFDFIQFQGLEIQSSIHPTLTISQSFVLSFQPQVTPWVFGRYDSARTTLFPSSITVL